MGEKSAVEHSVAKPKVPDRSSARTETGGPEGLRIAPAGAGPSALHRAIGNHAVGQALNAQRTPAASGPVVEVRTRDGVSEVVLGNTVLVRSTMPVDLHSVSTVAGDLGVLVTAPEGAIVEFGDRTEIRAALGAVATRWLLRAVVRGTEGEMRRPVWRAVDEMASAAAPAATQALPPLPSAKPPGPEQPPKIPLQRGYPDPDLDDAVNARGPLVGKLTNALSEDQLRLLAVEDRLALIDRISSQRSVSDRDQQTLSRLVFTAPPHEYGVLADGLKAQKGRLLRRLDKVLTGSDLDAFYGAATPVLLGSTLDDENYARYENALHLQWSGPPLVRPDKMLDSAHPDQAITITYDLSWTESGRLRIRWRKTWLLAEGPPGEAILGPDDVVALHFLNGDPDLDAKQGEVRYLPAVALFALVHRQFRREMWGAVQTAMTVGGVAGAAGAVTWLGRIVAGIEAALGAAAYVVDQFREEIDRTEGGRDFLKRWDIAQSLIAIYGLARIVIALPKALRSLVKAFRPVRGALGSELQKAAEFERRMGEIELRLNEAEREAAAARTAGEASAGDLPAGAEPAPQGPAGRPAGPPGAAGEVREGPVSACRTRAPAAGSTISRAAPTCRRALQHTRCTPLASPTLVRATT